MAGLLSLSMTILIIANAAISIYTAYSKLPELEKLLPNSSLIQDSLKIFKTSGIIGRLYRQAIVCYAIQHSEYYHTQGLVDKNEIAQIPQKLWLWLAFSQRLTCITAIAMIPSYIFVEFIAK
jgi:hypothetical protein